MFGGYRLRGHAPRLGGLERLDTPLFLNVFDPLLDRGVLTRLRHRHEARRDRVLVDVRAGRQQRLFIEDRHALVPALEERPDTIPPKSQIADQGLMR
ncbi:hypothetical protein SAMN05444166_8170 [Singulisphaera sp. GP187]|uniref:hypothetical protein n=1 Tax=Singulisphaera sp. GP187 TaxID=1882752 RepID=UPI000926535D|nr:hypothetical protein [Singulisphaera sp. GP187]SIO66661.1 hypothetical protein SAMN05444166_8170 [Singulisphaera sp. GP187]